MKHKLTIIFTLLAAPLVLAKLIDVHLPSGEELYIEHMREQDRENRRAFDTLKDESASDDQKAEAKNTLVDNGVMA